MRLYKLKIKIISYYVFPFAFLRNWKESILVQWDYLKIKKYFKKLNWDYWQVQKKTQFCGSLDHAVDTLCYELTDDIALFPKLKKLIRKSYDTKWNTVPKKPTKIDHKYIPEVGEKYFWLDVVGREIEFDYHVEEAIWNNTSYDLARLKSGIYRTAKELCEVNNLVYKGYIKDKIS